MKHRTSVLRCAVLMQSAVIVFGCGDTDKSQPANLLDAGMVDEGDATGAMDLALPGPDDVLNVDATVDSTPEVLSEAVVSGGGATVRLSFDPFTLIVEDTDGDVKGRSRPLEDGSPRYHSGYGFARAVPFSARTYYDPSLIKDPKPVSWYHLSEVLEGEPIEGGVRFLVSSVDDEGVEGPAVEVELLGGESGVKFEVTLPDDPSLVYNNLVMVAQPAEGFYGFGEVFDRLDGRGSLRELQTQVELMSESSTNEVHVPVPFVLSTEGYGLFMDSPFHGVIDVGEANEDFVRWTTLDRHATWHFMVESTPMSLVQRYTEITGKPAHVPFWALAPHWWRNVTEDQAEVLEDARLSREQDIPATVLWIDRPWSSYYHNWKFDTERFPAPEAMFETLTSLGYRVMLHHSPQMNPEGQVEDITGVDDSEGLYARFQENDWLIKLNGAPLTFPWGGGIGGFVDYSHPDAVAEVRSHIQRVTQWGAVGTKMDWDELHQPNVLGSRFDLEYFNGEPALAMFGKYQALYHEAIIKGFDDALGEPSFHVSRSGFPRDQTVNTCIWPGDLDNDFSEHVRGPGDEQDSWNVGGLPAAIIANQSLGMGGYPCFASDIGGFRNGSPDKEVLVRWIAFGVFNGVMQLGGGGRVHMPWASDSPYDAETVDIARKYFKLRMQLVPYIFHHMSRAEKTGQPLVRSLWLEFPDDEETRKHERDFMFGPDLLVAPVYKEGALERAAYLPEGRWVDYWTGAIQEGGRVYTRAAPLDLIPVWLREGALIPMLSDSVDTLMPTSGDDDVVSLQERPEMTVLVVPGEASSISLYNGLDISSTQADDTLIVDVQIGSPLPDSDRRFAIVPQRVSLELMGAAGTPTLTRGDQLITLEESSSETCSDCWTRLSAPDRLRVVLSAGGVVKVDAQF